jgi:predicted nucleic acid-binding protein
MTEKSFVDTNVLVYASIDEDAVRSPVARQLLRSLGRDRLVMSTQVLLEYTNVAIRKFGVKGFGLQQILTVGGLAQIMDTTEEDIYQAVRLTQSAGISIWDAMIVAAAVKAGCDTLYTEDLNAGQIISGVRIVNPF